MSRLEKALTDAKMLVQRGLLKHRDVHTVETKQHTLCNFASPSAHFFSPYSAVLRVVRGMDKKGVETEREAMRLLKEAGYSMAGYRAVATVDDAVAWFDMALALLAKEERRSNREQLLKREDPLRLATK